MTASASKSSSQAVTKPPVTIRKPAGNSGGARARAMFQSLGMCFSDGLLFTTAGYPDRTRMAIRTGGSGDVTGTEVAWSSRRQVTYVPSPVYDRGHIYSVIDEGMLVCFDAKTGESKWDQRLGGRFRASLLLANGIIYAANDKGLTTIFRASPESFQQDLGQRSRASFAMRRRRSRTAASTFARKKNSTASRRPRNSDRKKDAAV